jgi:ribosomal protein S18 acetylase RimI-like enzyme
MVEIRAATPRDARAVATVNVLSWRVAYRGRLPDEILDGLSIDAREEFWSDVLTTRPRGTRVSVAASAGTVVGFAATGPPLVPVDRADPGLGDLYALYLRPDTWRRGIGTQLHAAALAGLRQAGFDHAGLWVLTTNDRALRFYEHLGWTDTGRIQVDTGPGGVELHERRLHHDLSGSATG